MRTSKVKQSRKRVVWAGRGEYAANRRGVLVKVKASSKDAPELAIYLERDDVESIKKGNRA